MVDRGRGLAHKAEKCREYVSLEVVSIPKSVRLSTTGMRLVSIENVGQIATTPRMPVLVYVPVKFFISVIFSLPVSYFVSILFLMPVLFSASGFSLHTSTILLASTSSDSNTMSCMCQYYSPCQYHF